MPLADEDRKILGRIARDALAAALARTVYAPPEQNRAPLLDEGGCFVTVKTDGRLRGCIGCFFSDQPIYKTVAEYTRHSVLDDPRFVVERLSPGDESRIAMDVSILSPLEKCPDPRGITLGVHGIHVRKGGRSGCFLPQVAEETGWTVEEFWGHCCRDKAGLAWDAWLRPETELLTFTAEVIEC